jgi:hypothetical protein
LVQAPTDAQTIQAFSAHLRDELALDTLRAELLALVEETMQPIQASLWLRPPAPSTAVDGPALWWACRGGMTNRMTRTAT